jgi:hypothetical protein
MILVAGGVGAAVLATGDLEKLGTPSRDGAQLLHDDLPERASMQGRDAPRSAFVVEEPVWVNVSDPTVHVNGDHAQYLDRTLRCRHVAGPPYVADDESLEVRWFLLADLPTMRPSLQERIVTAVEHVGPVRLI